MFEKIKLRLFIGVLFLGCLATTSAFGQSSWTYTDTWMDDDTGYDATGENSEVYIVGAGVTEINPNSQTHEANLWVEIRSPQGRTEYGGGTWYQGSSGTSITAVVSLNFIWQPAEVGNYLTTTGFQEVCPFSPGTLYGGASLPVNIKKEVYVLIGDVPYGGKYGYGFCEYDNYCPFGLGICGLPEFSVDRFTANATCSGTIQCQTLYVRGTCYNRAKVCTGTTGNGVCDYN